MYRFRIKRLIDVIVSLLGMILLSPIFIFVTIVIKATSKGPALFNQNRVGKNNKIFKIYKFRTMRIDTPKDCPTHLLDNPEQYITRIGSFLRKTSLDELPQLWNILIGDMSIIGPRPSLTTQYDLNELRNLNGSSSIRPGLTGLAQISGRDELEIEVKASFDGTYTENVSFIGDIVIFFKTITSVIGSKGVKEGKAE